MSFFEDLMKVQVDDVPEPKVLPAGVYRVMVEKPPKFGESVKKKTPELSLPLQFLECVQPDDDEELEEYGAENIPNKKMDFKIWFSEEDEQKTSDAVYRFIHNTCGEVFGLEVAGKTVAELCSELPSCAAMAVIVHQRDPEDENKPPYAQIKRLIAAE